MLKYILYNIALPLLPMFLAYLIFFLIGYKIVIREILYHGDLYFFSALTTATCLGTPFPSTISSDIQSIYTFLCTTVLMFSMVGFSVSILLRSKAIENSYGSGVEGTRWLEKQKKRISVISVCITIIAIYLGIFLRI